MKIEDFSQVCSRPILLVKVKELEKVISNILEIAHYSRQPAQNHSDARFGNIKTLAVNIHVSHFTQLFKQACKPRFWPFRTLYLHGYYMLLVFPTWADDTLVRRFLVRILEFLQFFKLCKNKLGNEIEKEVSGLWSIVRPSYWAVRFCGVAFYMLYKVVRNFDSERYEFLKCCLLCYTRWF